ncbi:hypothetical protein TNCV_1759951 [Trichonephila clavipes]|nr:hypothetical protein TNCV_1759951 [Trichonephila clavipes]
MIRNAQNVGENNPPNNRSKVIKRVREDRKRMCRKKGWGEEFSLKPWYDSRTSADAVTKKFLVRQLYRRCLKVNHLEDNIRRVIADIRPQLLEKVIENWTSRLDYILCQKSYLKCNATRLSFE